MLFRDRVKSVLLVLALLLPIGLGLYSGLHSGLGRADFVFVNQGEVSSLDPALATGIPEGRILMATSEGLLGLDPETLEPIPGCAESWELSGDHRQITFNLRKGLKWSNGAPLLAEDFIFSWTRLLAPETASPYAYLLWEVEGAREFTEGGRSLPKISARDDKTLVVELKRVCPYFPVLTTFYPLFPVYRDPRTDEKDIAICNGPFLVEARLLKDRIRLAKNPLYWDADQVSIDTVDALAITSPITALNLYLTGVVDWINHVPPIVLPFMQDRDDFSLTPNLGTNFLRANVTKAPLDDAKVRRAIHLAIDKSALVEYVLKGGQLVATSFVPPGIPGYSPPTIEPFDPDEARRLLTEAGFPDGRDFPDLNLLYQANESNRDVTEVIALQLKEHLKIKVHPMAQERKGYFVSQNSLAYDLCLCSWLGDYLDVSTFLDVFRSHSGNNRTGWKLDGYDALLEKAAMEMDVAARARIMSQAESMLLAQMPIVPLYFRTTSNLIRPEWEGYYDNIQDVHPLKYIRRKAQ